MKRIGAALLLIFFSSSATPSQAFFWGKPKASKQAVAAEPVVAPAKTPLTLPEAYTLTLARSESLAITKEAIDQAQARFYRSFDYFLPQVHFVMTRKEQDVDDDFQGGSSDSFTSDSRRRTTPLHSFTFHQPIFSGFREIAALTGSGADRKTQEFAYQRAKETLFSDVMDSFYAVLQAEKDVRILEATQKLLTDRMKELDERVKLGRSRDSEMKTSFSDAKGVEADLVIARAALRTARNLLAFYVGKPVDSFELVDEDVPAAAFEAPDLAAKAAKRMDVQSLEQAYIVAQKKLTSAHAGLYPEVSIDGNYYTKRTGFQSGNDWDVLLTVDVPIFEAGQNLGDIKEASSLRRAAGLRYEESKRLAELDIANASEDLHSAKAAGEALAAAELASKENYDILTHEYRNNLVNNLDVLDSLRRYQETRRRQNAAYYDVKRSYWKYRVALGEIL